MGLSERPTNYPKNQGPTRPGPARQPRRRRCLLKGCEKNFHPQQAAERYCSEECRKKARQWCEWKAQLRYRATQKGTEKRKAQCRRYRERIRNRKEPVGRAAGEATRVISPNFFRWFLRPARVLSGIRPHLEITPATILLEAVPARGGAGGGAGTAMARAADRLTAAGTSVGSRASCCQR